MKKPLVLLLLYLLPAPLAFFGVRGWLIRKLGVGTVLFVRKNTGLNQLALDLQSAGVVKHPRFFKFLMGVSMKIHGKRHVGYGEYLLEASDNILTIVDKLINNRIFYRSITFPEGLSNRSIFNIIDKNEFLSGEIANRRDIAEGSLLAETYYFKREDSRGSLVERMRRAMEEFVESSWKTRDPDHSPKTKGDLLILASIVEKEAGSGAEKKLIASVFLNRLKKNMRLQSDPTAIYSYALGDVEKEKKLKTSVLVKMRSPYNTYLVRGLPPTPICNPGKESIAAVLRPAKSDYLFFVIDDRGGHNFSTNYRDHLKFVDSLRAGRRQKRPGATRGKAKATTGAGPASR
ncbi:MAG: endolytic transglycosylase MltG [Rickettsiales bacterium]|nr:endolytic transglycosylase MltG [Rickettsiales bacterium]